MKNSETRRLQKSMKKAAFLVTLLAFMLPSARTSAQQTEPDHYVDVRVIPQTETIKPGENLDLAIEYTIYPEWHLYWKNPGDSGIPIKNTWTLPEGFEIEEIRWPLPEKILVEPLANYGYKDTVILLQNLKAPETLPEGPIDLEATVDMLVCKDVCIPETAQLRLTLNTGIGEPADNTAIIEKAAAHIPQPLSGTTTFTEENNRLITRFKPETPEKLKNVQLETAEFFPAEWGVINHFPKPEQAFETDGTLVISQERSDTDIAELEVLEGLLTWTDSQGTYTGYAITAKPGQNGTSSVPVAGPADTSPVSPETENAGPAKVQKHKPELTSFSMALLFAFLGGLILNLMPCVFPVISMKALSLAKLSGKEKAEARAHGLAYTAGVIASFIVVGMLLVFLKTAGSAVGWGFQLQNPVVVAGLAYVLFLVGLNLMGFFEIRTNLGNIGSSLADKHSMAGSFFTGVLATVVATPCMAPFMAAALGYALVQNAGVALSIFIALGFGLAFPYLLLCYIPAAQKWLPRPGAWMKTFKQFLAFPMFAFSIWLVSILAQQSGPEGVFMTLLGMLFLAMAVWLTHFRKPLCNCGILARTPLLVCLLLPVMSLYAVAEIPPAGNSYASSESFGESYSPVKLALALESKNPVFVEMTAAWCITCKVNHRLAINIESTRKTFKDNNIEYLIGDWTNYDKEITAYLEEFGRSGVPVYIFYGAPDESGKRPDPVLLPQILTPGIIHAAVNK
ncbi:MAG: thioredoxin family protein [Alphaproteobacteria bacterium]|nr:thioredoxin family protein [Alphaproteobacteria bacterium]MCB9975250.1 thioredoxin family protein [Rhodospirillales bacterium]